MINKKLQIDAPLNAKTLRGEDIVHVVRQPAPGAARDAADGRHRPPRQPPVRSVGELLENQFRVGLTRMERAVKERMSISDITNLMPHDLINAKPVSAVVKEFFGSSQLSQFMDQTNPLAELTHKRRLFRARPARPQSRAGRVRGARRAPDPLRSHLPIETPEGPNIGLISSLSTYAGINEFGFIHTPYRKVVQGTVTDEIVRLTALEEEQFVIAQANAELTGTTASPPTRVGPQERRVPHGGAERGPFHGRVAEAAGLGRGVDGAVPRERRRQSRPHGLDMQRQAVPLLQPEAPLVGTGMEHIVARATRAR